MKVTAKPSPPKPKNVAPIAVAAAPAKISAPASPGASGNYYLPKLNPKAFQNLQKNALQASNAANQAKAMRGLAAKTLADVKPGSTPLTGKLHEEVLAGGARPETEAAKWKELEANGFDRSKFDAKGYLATNKDVAKYWHTDSGKIDPELAAATHYFEYGRFEGRAPGKIPPPPPNTKPLGTDEFNKMSQDQKYDYLQNVAVERAAGDPSVWKTGDKELNLIGARSFSGGKRNAGKADEYNDTIFAVRMNNGKKEVFAFDATTDPGAWKNIEDKSLMVTDAKGQGKGIAQLADGFFQDAFTRGKVSGDANGLRQTGWVRANIDKNMDGKISEDEKLGLNGRGRLAGADMQFQFHPGGFGNVGQTSAGCQAIRGDQWGQFSELLSEAPESQKTFSYALVDSSSLRTASDYKASGKINNYVFDPVNVMNKVAAEKGLYLGIDVDSKGRGIVGNDIDVLGFRDTKGDERVTRRNGNYGIGIIRTPYWLKRAWGYFSRWR